MPCTILEISTRPGPHSLVIKPPEGGRILQIGGACSPFIPTPIGNVTYDDFQSYVNYQLLNGLNSGSNEWADLTPLTAYTSRRGSDQFLPLSAMLAWYDASDSSSLILNGSTVSELKDKSYTADASRPENLLLQSETFNTTWSRNGINAFSSSDSGGPGSGSFANTTRSLDPFGGNNADFIQESGSTGTHYIFQSSINGVGGHITGKFWVKYGGRNTLRFLIGSSSYTPGFSSMFNLSTLSIFGQSTNGSVTEFNASITDVGDDWRLISMSASLSATVKGYFEIIMGSGSNVSYTGDNTSGLFLYGAQLRRTLSSSADYVATTTLPEYAEHSLLQSTAANQPIKSRSDNKANLLTYSETFESSSWSRTRINAFGSDDSGGPGSGSFANTTRSLDPDGGNNSDFIQEDATENNLHALAQSVTTPGDLTVLEVYAKPAGRTWIYLRIGGAANYVACYFDVENGVLGSAVKTGLGSNQVGYIEPANNGFYLCRLVGSTNIATSNTAGIWTATGNGGNVYDGDNTSGVFIYKASYRPASCDSDYIQTTAVPVYPGLNNHSILRFDGTNDYIVMAAQNLDLPLTILTVFRQITWTDSDYIFSSVSTSGGRLQQRIASPGIRIVSNVGSNVSNDLDVGNWGIATTVFKGDGSWLNINNGASITADIASVDLDGLSVGASNGGSSAGNIEFAEMLIFNRELTDIELTSIKNYLSDKWAITL